MRFDKSHGDELGCSCSEEFHVSLQMACQVYLGLLNLDLLGEGCSETAAVKKPAFKQHTGLGETQKHLVTSAYVELIMESQGNVAESKTIVATCGKLFHTPSLYCISSSGRK